MKLNQPSPSWEHDERLGKTEIVVQDPISLLAVSGELTAEEDDEGEGQGGLQKKKGKEQSRKEILNVFINPLRE